MWAKIAVLVVHAMNSKSSKCLASFEALLVKEPCKASTSLMMVIPFQYPISVVGENVSRNVLIATGAGDPPPQTDTPLASTKHVNVKSSSYSKTLGKANINMT